jgi:hypothetical protein
MRILKMYVLTFYKKNMIDKKDMKDKKRQEIQRLYKSDVEPMGSMLQYYILLDFFDV